MPCAAATHGAPLVTPTHTCDPAGKGSLDNINLFSIITILSFFILTPIALLLEGVTFTPAALTAAGVLNHTLLLKRAVIAALCFHAYQQVSG